MKTRNTTKKASGLKCVHSWDPSSVRHRIGVTRCPHCDHDSDEWEKSAVLLVLCEVHGKHGYVVVVNECPKCFEKSWVHQPFTWFQDYHDEYPEEWKTAAQKEYTRRHVAAVSKFADSLCAKCAHLRKLECETLPIIKCTYGEDEEAKLPVGRKFYYHSCFTTSECPAFTARVSH